MIDPEIIVIGGGVSKAGDILTSRITQSFKKYVFNACASTPIVLANLENDAGMYGCVKSLFKFYLKCKYSSLHFFYNNGENKRIMLKNKPFTIFTWVSST